MIDSYIVSVEQVRGGTRYSYTQIVHARELDPLGFRLGFLASRMDSQLLTDFGFVLPDRGWAAEPYQQVFDDGESVR